MRPLASDDLVRGQFAGYRNEPGVAPDSDVETFCALRLCIDSWRWAGVPWYLRSGKCLPTTATEILVELKPPPQQLFADSAPSQGAANYLRFRLSPEWDKTPSRSLPAPPDSCSSSPAPCSSRRRCAPPTPSASTPHQQPKRHQPQAERSPSIPAVPLVLQPSRAADAAAARPAHRRLRSDRLRRGPSLAPARLGALATNALQAPRLGAGSPPPTVFLFGLAWIAQKSGTSALLGGFGMDWSWPRSEDPSACRLRSAASRKASSSHSSSSCSAHAWT
jgi:hypothetical protein